MTTATQESSLFDADVIALTEKWTDVLSPTATGRDGYTSIDYEPLLDMLRQSISSSTGKTDSGRSAVDARSVMNVAAFDLWERIDGITRSWIRDLGNVKPAKELKDAVTQLHRIITDLWRTNQIEERKYLRIGGMFEQWREQIWAQYDPPTVKQLTGACPNCHETHNINPDGDRNTALYAFFWKGYRPQAQCRGCSEEWTGVEQLVELAKAIGANIDIVTLRQMGFV